MPPRVGDQLIWQGHLYWLRLIITMAEGKVLYALQQPQWPKQWHIIVDSKDVIVDPPPVA